MTRRELLRSRLAIMAGAVLAVTACGGTDAAKPDTQGGGGSGGSSGGVAGGSSGGVAGSGSGSGGGENPSGGGGTGDDEVVHEVEEESCAGMCGSHHSCDDNGVCPPYGAPALPEVMV